QSTPDIPQTSPTQIYTHYFSTRPGLRTPPVKPQVPYTCLVCPKKDSITLLENTILANPAVPNPIAASMLATPFRSSSKSARQAAMPRCASKPPTSVL